MSAFTLTATELRDWLQPAIACAGTDHDLPVLSSVLIERDGAVLTATATGRYRAGICMHQLPGKPRAKGRVLAPLAPLVAAMKVIAPARMPRDHAGREVTLRLGDNTLTITGPLPRLDIEVTFTIKGLNAGYPAVASLVTAATTENEGDTIPSTVLNPTFLGAFAAAIRNPRSEGMELRFPTSRNRPVGVLIGDHFRGCIMPRLPEARSAESVALWERVLPKPAEPQAA